MLIFIFFNLANDHQSSNGYYGEAEFEFKNIPLTC
ncbi:hypothetical protein HDC90_001405 [Pedobacter sp. AK013]|nr:hypothetical protein [Pedobacter sp. AK013]